jgi:hypothetical protein
MMERDPELRKEWVQIVRTLPSPPGRAATHALRQHGGIVRRSIELAIQPRFNWIIFGGERMLPGLGYERLFVSSNQFPARFQVSRRPLPMSHTRRRRILCQPRASPWVNDK